MRRTQDCASRVLLAVTLINIIIGSAAVVLVKDNLLSGQSFSRHDALPSSAVPHSVPQSRASMLTKRTGGTMFANLGLRSSDLIGAIQPTAPAAATLEHFYNVMFWCATQSWPQQTPQPNFIISYGAFELAMFASGGPIPWQWMADFARMMSQASSQGFTSTYHMLSCNPEETHVISIAMTIKAAVDTAGHVADIMRGANIGQIFGEQRWTPGKRNVYRL